MLKKDHSSNHCEPSKNVSVNEKNTEIKCECLIVNYYLGLSEMNAAYEMCSSVEINRGTLKIWENII